jgi:UDP-glucose 4-epimerase
MFMDFIQSYFNKASMKNHFTVVADQNAFTCRAMPSAYPQAEEMMKQLMLTLDSVVKKFSHEEALFRDFVSVDDLVLDFVESYDSKLYMMHVHDFKLGNGPGWSKKWKTT